ncbi:hypothetical protein P5V15_003568 [Pogonomyrmex californicus]
MQCQQEHRGREGTFEIRDAKKNRKNAEMFAREKKAERLKTHAAWSRRTLAKRRKSQTAAKRRLRLERRDADERHKHCDWSIKGPREAAISKIIFCGISQTVL